jgi:hypothetical protein
MGQPPTIHALCGSRNELNPAAQTAPFVEVRDFEEEKSLV